MERLLSNLTHIASVRLGHPHICSALRVSSPCGDAGRADYACAVALETLRSLQQGVVGRGREMGPLLQQATRRTPCVPDGTSRLQSGVTQDAAWATDERPHAPLRLRGVAVSLAIEIRVEQSRVNSMLQSPYRTETGVSHWRFPGSRRLSSYSAYSLAVAGALCGAAWRPWPHFVVVADAACAWLPRGSLLVRAPGEVAVSGGIGLGGEWAGWRTPRLLSAPGGRRWGSQAGGKAGPSAPGVSRLAA